MDQPIVEKSKGGPADEKEAKEIESSGCLVIFRPETSAGVSRAE